MASRRSPDPTRFRDELGRLARVVDVPGTPRRLRLDGVDEHRDGRVLVRWSYDDPEVRVGERPGHGRRVRGELDVPARRLDQPAAVWADVQLTAGRAYVAQVDGDWEPGEPYVRRVWTADEAWRALISFLETEHDDVVVDHGAIRARRGDEEVVLRLDPEQWAAFLTTPEPAWSDTSAVVPVATPLDRGLPQWAVDELEETVGSAGRLVEIVGGRLVGSEPRR